MGSVIPFSFSRADGQSFQVRTFLLDGAPWFIGMDVASTLGYADTDKAIRQHCKLLKKLNPAELAGLGITSSSPFGMTVIPESDVYGLIMRSRLPEAEVFAEWVKGEVLPSIRTTGSYSVSPVDDATVYLGRITTAIEALAVGMMDVNKKVGHIDKEVKQLGKRLERAEDRIDNVLPKRRGPVKGTVELHAKTIAQKRFGKCPNCNSAIIVDKKTGLFISGRCHVHHTIEVHTPDQYHTWPLCVACHKLCHRSPHDAFTAKFNAYQQDMRQVESDVNETPLFRFVPKPTRRTSPRRAA